MTKILIGVSPPTSSAPPNPWSRPTLPVLLSLTAGYVDTAGFLALQGLFTAHVTGNFVTLGASLVLGTSGTVAKIVALPTFCLVVIGTRLASYELRAHRVPILRVMLGLEVILLGWAATLAAFFGPFRTADAPPAIVTGLALVSAMAIQNAAHRIHLGPAPPTTLMTGTTTQMMIDVADLLRRGFPALPPAKRGRLLGMSASVAAFALGCAGGALLFAAIGDRCFLVPPMLGVWSLNMGMNAYRSDLET